MITYTGRRVILRRGSRRTDEAPDGGPRRRDAAATRQALLQAARGRFMRFGYDGTTLRDVAADVGVNLALIKRYFDSKEGLFKAALAATPRFPGGTGEFPRDRAALAEALSHQLSAGAWPEYGEHPVLLLLRASGDERVDALRRQALQDFSRQVLEASGAVRATAATGCCGRSSSSRSASGWPWCALPSAWSRCATRPRRT